MRLGTKLTLYLSLIIVLVLSGYGYIDILSRREILIGRMKTQVRSTTQTLKVSLETIQLPEELAYVQSLIDAVSKPGNLGVIVYYQRENLTFHTISLDRNIEPFVNLIKRSDREDHSREGFDTYNGVPFFSCTLPFRDRTGKHIGTVSILQDTSLMEKEVEKSKWSMLVAISVLICGTVGLILLGTRKWVTEPISTLMNGINQLSKGKLDHRIDLRKNDELSRLAHAFNRMAVDLKMAREQILQEGRARLELERSLRQSEKLAAIGQLASGLAHEIGTPLNVIHGRAQLIQRRLEHAEDLQKYVGIIVNQTERITKIIQQLLGFVRKKTPDQQPLNVCALLGTTVDFLDYLIQKQGVGVVKDWEKDLPSLIGDPDQLQQAFLNLIINAIQSMPAGGTLRLSASLKMVSKQGLEGGPKQYIEVCVVDTGVGMDEEVVRQIFDPFFTTKNTGTGLGLMVARGIVCDHEGWIEVESEKGNGSLFRVYLPLSGGGGGR